MVEVQRVAALIAREATSNIVNPRQSHPVCSCVGSRASRLGRAAFCITEQDGGTPTLWEKGRREKRAVTHRNCRPPPECPSCPNKRETRFRMQRRHHRTRGALKVEK